MEASESCRSFTWKVRNFSFLWHREHQFLKWTFNMKGNIKSSWSLLFYPSTPKNCISCVLRKESAMHLNFLIDYELSFFYEGGSPLRSIQIFRADFNCKSRGVLLWLHQDDILKNKGDYLPQDTLIIYCNIRTTDKSVLQIVRYFAETEIRVHRNTFTWNFRQFSCLNPKKTIINLAEEAFENNLGLFSLFLDKWNNFIFEALNLHPTVEICKFGVFLIDASGRKLKCGRFEVVTIGKTTDPEWKFHLSLTKRMLVDNKELYLPNDTLSLQCEIALATGIVAEPVQKLEPSEDTENIISEANITDISTSLKKSLVSVPVCLNDFQSPHKKSSVEGELAALYSSEKNSSSSLEVNTIFNSINLKENKSESAISNLDDLQCLNSCYSEEAYKNLHFWKNDMLNLYENGTFCDLELLVASECFSVHSLILKIRSSVFCDKISREKSEGKRTSIIIEDLDADTVRKMIIFLYTDALENLEWESAKSLYRASNIYEIIPLKDKTSSFFKQNLSSAHCCDILLLADKYKDDDLKHVVQSFITGHYEKIINSDQWRSMEENHPRLTIETFRFLHLKLRKK